MKPRPSVLFLPFLLLAFLLGTDRLLNIEALQQKMRPRSTNMEVLDAFTGLVLEELQQSKDPRPLVLFIGSSRSLPFQILWDLPKDPFLEKKEKEYLKSYHFEARVGTPLPDMLSQLMILERLQDFAFPIDTIVLDASPFVLYNPTLVRRRWARNIYPENFLFREIFYLPKDLQNDALSRLFFQSYNYRLNPLLLLRNRDPRQTLPRAAALLLYKHPLDYRYKNRFDLNLRKSLTSKQSLFHKRTLAAIAELYKGYDPELGLANLFLRSLVLLRGRSKHLVLWLPATHPKMREHVYQKLSPAPNAEARFWKRYWEVLRKAHSQSPFLFYNGYQIRRKCDFWMDASHLSPRCYGLLALEILHCKNPTANCQLPKTDRLPYPESP